MGNERIGRAYLHFDILLCRFFSTGSPYTDTSNATFPGHCKSEIAHGITRLIELHALARCALRLHQGQSFNLNLHVFHMVFHGKYVYRQIEFLARPQHTRQTGQYHQGLFHRHGKFSTAVSLLFAGHHHNAHRTHILRNGDRMRDGFSRFEVEGPNKTYHRFKAVSLGPFAIHGRTIATHAQHPTHFAVVGTNYAIVHIPSFNA